MDISSQLTTGLGSEIASTIIGQPRDRIDTPALCVDLDALERNIQRMADFFAGLQGPSHALLRPHTKTHKTPQIAHKQIAAGAKGVTCAKVGEAEVMAAAGINDILIANQIIGATKIRRLMSLANQVKITVAVDSARNIAELSEIALQMRARIGVLVEVNTGLDRCGVDTPEEALALARLVLAARNLEFVGLQGYEGHTVSIPNRSDRQTAAGAAIRRLLDAKEQIEGAGVSIREVSGGGTGTYDITGRLPEMTEIQAGSYVTMDSSYDRLGLPFEQALTILATVISRTTPSRGVIDCGLKAMSTEFGLPQLLNLPGVKLAKLSEEHAKLDFDPSSNSSVEGAGLMPGDKIQIVPSHGCTTINLHDQLYGIRDGYVESLWRIAARGKFV